MANPFLWTNEFINARLYPLAFVFEDFTNMFKTYWQTSIDLGCCEVKITIPKKADYSARRILFIQMLIGQYEAWLAFWDELGWMVRWQEPKISLNHNGKIFVKTLP